MRNTIFVFVGVILPVASLVTVACSSSSDSPVGNAGSPATGGTAGSSSGSGGSTSTSGGSTGGAAVSPGGAAGMGGNAGSAGTGGGGSASGGSASGGSGGAAPAGSVTTLSESKTLGSLSANEGTQLCNDTYAYFGTATPKPVACKWAGLAYAASSSSPTEEKLRMNCSSHEASCQDTVPWSMNSGCSPWPMTCQGTVGAYSSCIKAEIAAFTQRVNGLPGCDTITSQSTASVFETMSAGLPSDCDALAAMCPDLTVPNPTY